MTRLVFTFVLAAFVAAPVSTAQLPVKAPKGFVALYNGVALTGGPGGDPQDHRK